VGAKPRTAGGLTRADLHPRRHQMASAKRKKLTSAPTFSARGRTWINLWRGARVRSEEAALGDRRGLMGGPAAAADDRRD